MSRFKQDDKGRNRYERLLHFCRELLHLSDAEEAKKLWNKKPKHMAKEKEIYIVPVVGRPDYDKEVQKLIDGMAKILDELDEKIDKWF